MVTFANTRDNILDEHERAASARKCLQILNDWPTKRKWPLDDLNFFYSEQRASRALKYAPDNDTLLRLRDMVEKHVTR
jgi:hypothetical protein